VTEHVVRVPPFASLASLGAWIRAHAWVAGWWLVGRAVVVATAAVVAATGPRGFLHTEEGHGVLGVLGAWDGRWYRMVASNGYLLIPGRQSDPAFFPLYPLLLRAVHVLGIGYVTAGVLLSNLALLAALLAFHALTRELLGAPLARRATAYVAIFPLGYVFSMAYPESVVLCAIAVAGLGALRGRWGIAALAAAAAALARPEGLFVALPILAVAWHRRAALSPVQRGLALGAVLAPAAALVSFPAYLDRVLHDPLAWSRAEHAWGRQFRPLGVVTAFEHLPRAAAQNPWVVRDVVALAVYLALFLLARRTGAPWAWLLAGIGVVVLPVFSASFQSIGRFGLLAPPVFWGLAWLGRGRRADNAIRIASVVLLVAATATVPLIFP
jgi:hypothetical protein